MERHCCTGCRRTLPAWDFAYNGSRGGWLDDAAIRRRSRCRFCERVRRQKRYDNNEYKKIRAHMHHRADDPFDAAMIPPMHDRLPIEPFAAWLGEKRDQYAKITGLGTDHFAVKVGLSARQIMRYINKGQPTISLGTVDRVLINEGSTGLWELYPQCYPDEVEVVAL